MAESGTYRGEGMRWGRDGTGAETQNRVVLSKNTQSCRLTV